MPVSTVEDVLAKARAAVANHGKAVAAAKAAAATPPPEAPSAPAA